MAYVKPKKSLGQHFLNDTNIAQKIVGSLTGHGAYDSVLEVGPGTGVLTQFLLKQDFKNFKVVEIDHFAISVLLERFPELEGRLFHADFLKFDMDAYLSGRFAVIGNFPYNISTQIMFRVLEMRDRVPEVVGMFQKEVAQRIASPPGGKQYGILSVLLKAWYDVELLFEVPPQVFFPPPKVQSAVIRIKRNAEETLGCDEDLFVKVVKAGFNQRRKTLRNALKAVGFQHIDPNDPILDRRAETLSVAEFVTLTNHLLRT
jgi:16S rRNA (adenine1518-N6/adenine1519-N6)-dimethyltransferase